MFSSPATAEQEKVRLHATFMIEVPEAADLLLKLIAQHCQNPLSSLNFLVIKREPFPELPLKEKKG